MMKHQTIFDLPQSEDDLPSLNQGLARLDYDQVQIQRSYTGATAFGNGDLSLKWSTSGSTRWIPSRSYVRMRLRIQDSGGNPIDMVDDIAPAMNCVGNLFTGADLRLNGKSLSRISENFPQVDALCQRIYKSQSQLDSGQAASQWMQASFNERQNLIASDGYYSKDGGVYSAVDYDPETDLGFAAGDTLSIAATGVATFTPAVANKLPNLLKPGDEIVTGAVAPYAANESYLVTEVTNATSCKLVRTDGTALAVRALAAIFSTVSGTVISRYQYGTKDNISNQRSSLEVIWQPLALPIWRSDKAYPVGDWELVLNTQDSSNWQEYLIESGYVDKTVTTDFIVNVVDCFLEVAVCEGPNMNGVDMDYLVDQDEIQCQIQDVDTGASNQFKRFNVSPNTQALAVAFQDISVGANNTTRPVSKFRIRSNAIFTNGELSLNRFYVLYNGEQKPSPESDPSFSSPRDYLKQRYMETQLYSGNYFNPGGCENYNDWLERGLFMYFAWPKDGNSGSSAVSVNYSFSVSNSTNANVLLFNWSKKLGYVSIRNGKVDDVKVVEAS